MSLSYLKKLEYELKLRRYSPNTIKHYCCHLRRFQDYYKHRQMQKLGMKSQKFQCLDLQLFWYPYNHSIS